jgi:hypothetical protein
VEERDPEALGAVVVDPTNFSEFFPEHEADTAVGSGGFSQATADNRKARRAGVANWAPPVPAEGEPAMPTRRDLLQQRKRRDRGTVDVALRRLQRSAIRKVKR